VGGGPPRTNGFCTTSVSGPYGYEQFRASIVDWSDIAERAFLNSRRLA
jgi:hypothetical protein